ncbi:MAG: hypothetical protein DRH93_18020 [Deltaproteobacteria bacterium]|nr:MAG: hypothetical protein DRH93_18020 [Deltaproteobacteria bacterium]
MKSDLYVDSYNQTRCPDEEILMNYLEGLLSKSEHTALENHIAGCDRCLETLVMAKSLMLDKELFELKPVPEAVTKKAVSLVSGKIPVWPDSFIVNLKRSVKHIGARMFDSFGVKPWTGWQLAQIRGSKIAASEDFVCLKVPFAKIETEVEIEKLKNETAHIRVKLAKPIEKTMTLRVTLKKGEREIASYILNDFIAFEHMPFDHYNISLFLDGVSQGTYFFKIKETRNGNK